MIDIKDIQKRLREAIACGVYTQKQIEQKLGVSEGTVSKYMRLDKFPAIDTFANLCEIFDISADDILGIEHK